MTQRSRFVRPALVLALVGATCGAWAQSAGNWVAKIGVNRMVPDVDSGSLTPSAVPNAKIDMGAATSLLVTATYFYTDNLSVEAFAGLPYKHDVIGKGSLDGTGKLATIRQIAPTVFAQWHFGPAQSRFRPYLGLGLTYAYFFDEQGSATLTALTAPGGAKTRVSTDSAWGVSPQAGVKMTVSDRWLVDLGVVQTYLKTKTHLSTGQSIEHRLDPLSIHLSAGYRF